MTATIPEDEVINNLDFSFTPPCETRETWHNKYGYGEVNWILIADKCCPETEPHVRMACDGCKEAAITCEAPMMCPFCKKVWNPGKNIIKRVERLR